jgi:hypothetical protein
MLPMAAMVVCPDDEAGDVERGGKAIVAAGVLRQPVEDMDSAPWSTHLVPALDVRKCDHPDAGQ